MTRLPSVEILRDFLPLAQRVRDIDVATPIRFRGAASTVSAYVRLPYDVIAGQTITVDDGMSFDATVEAFAFIDWVEGRAGVPPTRDALWLQPLPPRAGWRRVEVVPDSDIRDVVRTGAQLAQTTSTRSAQESLLASTVLTATSGQTTVEVPLGPLSALTRMGFLPRDSHAGIDVAPGWIRVAAPFGSTYVATSAGLLGSLLG